MKILLISPRSEDDVYIRLFREIPYIQNKSKEQTGAYVAPHAVATVAALTPPEHEVHIHDEHVRGWVEPHLEKSSYDIIGISMLTNQLKRTFKIAEFCKKKNLPAVVVVGGAGTSMLDPRLKRVADVIFCGEAEETWPQFLKDFKEGNHKPVYQQITKPDASKFPVPRWNLIREDMPVYGSGAVQTTRGCPYDCVYCDVIYIYGRKVRCKPIEKVLEEIRILESLGSRFILITDDNFGCNRHHAKELLRKLFQINNSFKIPLRFITQTDITIASDEELLRLMADSGLVEVLIGIESIREESLRDLNKLHNTRVDMREAVQKIQSYGITVLASMIVGTDSDDTGIFEQTTDFIREVNLTDHTCHPLMAPRGTKLWYRVKHEGRLVERPGDEWGDRMDILTNIIPKRMTRVELMEGLADYWETVSDPLHYMERAVGFIKGVRRTPKVKKTKWRAMWKYRKMMIRTLWYYLFEVTPDHRKAFFTILRTARKFAPFLMPQMMFLHTCFMINHKRAMIAAKLARERAAWEQSHPEELKPVDRSLPVPFRIRENATEIFTAAYTRVRERVGDRETLYKAVVEAMMDYTDRFGESFERFDEYQLDYVNESCDRILAHISLSQPGGRSDLPEEGPPGGFEREILDALDHAIGLRECVTA